MSWSVTCKAVAEQGSREGMIHLTEGRREERVKSKEKGKWKTQSKMVKIKSRSAINVNRLTS